MNLTRATARAVAVTLVAVSIGGGLAGASTAAGPTRAARPIVTVVRQGGLCLDRGMCVMALRITDTTISGDRYVPRRLKPGERLALLRAIRAIEPTYLRAHPFRGTCPTAYDGIESIYRFRGFGHPLASCRYDLRGVRAVVLTERLLATLTRKAR